MPARELPWPAARVPMRSSPTVTVSMRYLNFLPEKPGWCFRPAWLPLVRYRTQSIPTKDWVRPAVNVGWEDAPAFVVPEIPRVARLVRSVVLSIREAPYEIGRAHV